MSDSQKKEHLKEQLAIFGRALTVGGVSSAISKTTVAPIERIKIILQVQAKHPDIPADQRFKGVFDCALRLWRQQPEGRSFLVKLTTYWRGNGANVIRYFPMQAINFAFKDRYKKMLFPNGNKDMKFFEELVRNCAAGGLAGATGLTFVYPMDFARTRLTSDVGVNRKYKGMFDCIGKSFKEGGLRLLYKGYGVSVCGIIPYRATYFGGYDMAKKYLMNGKPEEKSFFFRWAVSQTTSVFSQFVAYPFDTVRRRMQLVGGGKDQLYKNSLDCFKRIYVDEGFASFFKGAMANVVRATGCALVLVFYDTIGHFLFCDKDYGSH